jgi:hypothetical protein
VVRFQSSAGRAQGGELGLVQWALELLSFRQFFRLEHDLRICRTVKISAEKALDKASQRSKKCRVLKNNYAGLGEFKS